MSGTGQGNFGAPTRLTPIAVDQPIGMAADGSPIQASMYFAQMITRMLAYLGQPGPSSGGVGGGGPNLTISEQLTQLTEAVEAAQNQPGTSSYTINARISALESQINSKPWEVRPTIDVPRPPTVLPRSPGLSHPQVMARVFFGF